MKFVVPLLVGLLLLGGNAQAQQPRYDQAQLDSMLAPIALQPDGVVSQVLIAATYPEEVSAAAAWARANPHMRGDPALRAVENEPWDPAVKALVAFPELLIRMDESPQWMSDLGQAFIEQQAQVMDTVQALRRRAQAAGHLASTDQYSVSQEGEAIVVEPRSQIVYVRYYDPYVVYGPWWWPHYHPVFWHPWVARPVFVAHGFWYTKPHWHHRHVNVVHKPVHVHHHHGHRVAPGKWQHHKHHVVSKPHGHGHVSKPHGHVSKPHGHVSKPHGHGHGHVSKPHGHGHTVSKPHVRVPESQRRPIVQSHMPAASGFTQHHRQEVQRQHHRQEAHRQHPRQEVHRQHHRQEVRHHRGGQERSQPIRQDRGSLHRGGGGNHRGGGNGGGRGRG
jgi:Protein of unknown function (DUF3300)